jgi:DNA topoisomerase I
MGERPVPEASGLMPSFLVPLHERNDCHLPGGSPEGGQFCGTGTWASGGGRTQSRRAVTSGMRPATDKERRKLAIPPAYTNVMVAEDPKAELRATALSPATGNTAYFYSAAYKARQQRAKFDRIVKVQQHVERLAARIDTDVQHPTREGHHTAMTLRLILQTGMRNGTEPDGETFGASSLRLDHVTVEGGAVRFQFPGKGGKLHDLTVHDPVLARYAEQRRASGAETLFPHDGADTLSYLKTVSGTLNLKVHDLRTWYASVYADHLVSAAVRAGLAPTTVKEQKAFRKAVAATVANRLGNTPGMTLNTYIHPKIWGQIGWTG